MKPRKLISLFTLAFAASAGACAAGNASDTPAASESTGTTDEAQLIAATGNIMAWPAGTLAWNGLVGTWPIAIWSPAAIGAVAFDITGVTNLGITCLGFPNIVASTITTPYLNAFVPPVGAAGVWGTPFLGSAGLYAPAYGYTGGYAPFAGVGYGFGAFANNAALQGTFMNNAFTPGWNTWFTPALTANALMFSNLATLNSFTPYMFNVTFTAQSAAQASAITSAASLSTSAAFANAGLSIFATPIMPSAIAATTAAIPFSSMLYPIMLPLPALVPAAPLVGAPVAAGTLL